MKPQIRLTTFLTTLFVVTGIQARTINVNTQKDFDCLGDNLRKAIVDEDTVKVIFKDGTFFFNENHIFLYDISRKDCSIEFLGNNCTIIPNGPDFFKGDNYDSILSGQENFITKDGMPVSLFGSTHYCNDIIEIIDVQKRICRLTTDDKVVLERLPANCKILITQWYRSGIYPVTGVENGHIYFIADDLTAIDDTGQHFSINYDYHYGGMMPRYRLLTVDSGTPLFKEEQVHRCDSGCFLNLTDMELDSFWMTGFNFVGNSAKADPALIRMSHLKVKSATISGCTFKAIKSHVLHIDFSDNIHFNSNTLEFCLGNGIAFGRHTSGIEVTDNSFIYSGMDPNPSFCVQCSGNNYHIAHNVFRNFGHSAIAVGLGPDSEVDCLSGGIVEFNTICYDKDYLADVKDHSLMDSGAIYLTTIHNGAEIRNNYIHDIDGAKDNRGIFCDDGARNFHIHDNRIINIINSYAIDSRRVSAFEKTCGPANVNNTISGNITDSPIRFEGNETILNCNMHDNVIVRNRKNVFPVVTVANLKDMNRRKLYRYER